MTYTGWEDEETVDRLNVTGAEMKAIHACLDTIVDYFDNIIMDGNYFKQYTNPNGIVMKHKCVPKADSLYKCVSAAR